jgi:hypothetical protein
MTYLNTPPGLPFAQGGPVGRGRSVWLTILVTFVTFGIWTYIWSFQDGEELRTYRREGLGGGVYLVFNFFIFPLTMFMMADEVAKMYEREGEVAPISALWGLWFLLPLIGNIVWYIKIQNSLNDFWTARGASPTFGL